jgi:hypothetical protein
MPTVPPPGDLPLLGTVDRSPRALLEALLLALVLTLTLQATRSFALFQDGPALVDLFAWSAEGARNWHHPAYLPAAKLVAPLFDGSSAALNLVGALAFGFGCGLTWLLLRAASPASPRARWIGLACLLASPALWFHGRIVEVHGLQFAGAALSLALCAVVFQARAMGLLASVSAAVLLPALLHQANLVLALNVGVAALLPILWSPSGAGSAQPRWKRALARGLPALLGLLLALWLFDRILTASNALLEDSAGGSAQTILGTFWKGPALEMLPQELLFALPPMVPLCTLLLVPRLRKCWIDRPGVAAALCAGLWPCVFFLAFGEQTRGGYFLSALPAQCLLLVAALEGSLGPGLGWPPRRTRWAAPVQLLCLATLSGCAYVAGFHCFPAGAEALAAYRHGKLVALRALMAEEPGKLVLIVSEPDYQTLSGELVGLTEINVLPQISRMVQQGTDPSTLAASFANYLREQRETLGSPVLEWSAIRAPIQPHYIVPGFALMAENLGLERTRRFGILEVRY